MFDELAAQIIANIAVIFVAAPIPEEILRADIFVDASEIFTLLFRLRFPCTNRASRFDFDDSICHLGIKYVRRPWQVPLDRAEPVIFRPLTEPRDRDSRRFMPYVAYFMKNQSLHGGFILPIQLDNFFYSEQKPRLCRQAMSPSPRRCTAPNREYPSRRRFQKPLYIARKLVGHGDKGVVCRNRRVPVEQHVIDYGQHVIIEIIFPRIPFAFSPSSGEIARAYALHASTQRRCS